MRLDVYLCESGLAASRTEAKNFILNGDASVDGRIIKKPAFEVTEASEVKLDRTSKKYVSRGGIKLESALDAFCIDVSGARALDVGASSGGFTDCLLQRGAAHVIAVDSGTMQLSESLRGDGRVTSIEGFNARYMKPEDFEYVPDVTVMDVSFISATYIMPSIYNCLAEGGRFICLVKPQFEVGRANIGKGGVVKDAKARERAVAQVIDFAKNLGFAHKGTIVSPIEGGDGNVEYLAYFVK